MEIRKVCAEQGENCGVGGVCASVAADVIVVGVWMSFECGGR